MRKIVIHEVNVHIGGPPPAAGGSGKPKRRKARSRREDRTIDDEFERVSDRTASHVEAGQDDLVPDYGLPAATLGSIVAIPTFQSLEDTNDHDGDWDDVEDDLGHGTGDVDEHGGVPDGADEFSPEFSGDFATPLDDALAYEDAPTAEELEAAFRDWKEPEFCGLTSFWWRAFSSLLACAAAGTVPEGDLVGKAVRYLSGAGEPYSSTWTDDEVAAAREAFARGGETLGCVIGADKAVRGEPQALSFAALAVLGCRGTHDFKGVDFEGASRLDELLMEASGAFNSAAIADHASRVRAKPEVASRFLAAYREALRHDERIMRTAAEWNAVQDRLEGIYARRSEREAAVREAKTVEEYADDTEFEAVVSSQPVVDEDVQFLTAVYALGTARNAISRGALLTTDGGLDPSGSAG